MPDLEDHMTPQPYPLYAAWGADKTTNEPDGYGLVVGWLPERGQEQRPVVASATQFGYQRPLVISTDTVRIFSEIVEAREYRSRLRS